MIKIVNLTKKYKDTVAVDNLCLEIKKGELYSLLGVNGAGKTTTIKMLSCLTSATSGDAYVGGHSICREETAVKSIIALSPQQSAVAGGLTVYENLALICGIYKFSKDKTKSVIQKFAQKLGLCEVLYKKAKALSGGYVRRLSIAMALISEPEILFLDEPTLGLDVISRAELWDIIKALKGKVTIILTTHYMEEAEALSDRIGIMKNGRLLISDTAQSIMAHAGEDNFEKAFISIVKEAQ